MKIGHEILLWIVALGAVGVLGKFDYADALTQEAIEKEALPWRAATASAFEEARALEQLQHPLPCERWLAQWGPGEKPKPRCVKYAPVSQQ